MVGGSYMVHITVKNGLDIPIDGAPQGRVKNLPVGEEQAVMFADYRVERFKVLVKEGDQVLKGQAIASDKSYPERMFVSPTSGTVKQVRRGAKRSLEAIIIQRDGTDRCVEHEVPKEWNDREEMIQFALKSGIFTHIRQRPFNLLAMPDKLPRDIFISAVQSAPMLPKADQIVQGHEEDFHKGLEFLSQLSSGKVHLTHRKQAAPAIAQAPFVEHHTVSGPHPAGNVSLHIHKIRPIQDSQDVVWTLDLYGVITIGHLLRTGRYFTQRLIAICGGGIQKEQRCYVQTELGVSVAELIAKRNSVEDFRMISGDVLTGLEVRAQDFLHPHHCSFCVLEDNQDREFLHFFRLGTDKYSSHRVYLSGCINNENLRFGFTTNQHGEERAFIDGEIYDRVMPMHIPVMHLVKAVICEDFERAEELGLLEVDGEDFALPTFVCPSKVEMVAIMDEGLRKWAKEVLS